MQLPGFTAEQSLNGAGGNYRMASRPTSDQRVIPQSKLTCSFKAGRLAGRCLQLNYDHQLCMDTAADFYDFCNQHDL